MAAAAAIQKVTSNPIRKLLSNNNASNAPAQQTRPHDDEEEQREKQFIAHYEDTKEPLSPGHIAEESRNKRLGKSSRQLQLKDFELLKTLGTGMVELRCQELVMNCMC